MPPTKTDAPPPAGTDAARPDGSLTARVDAADWNALTDEVNEYGSALTGPLLTPGQCHEMAALYDDAERFRTTVDMARHRFGSGQYRYFTHDLPDAVRELREAFYPHLLPIARDWAGKLGRSAPWPDDLDRWLAKCHRAGQAKSAQILLRYGAGDWNALHRDVFGEMVFPLQVVIGLDAPGVDFTGGEFLMTEQRPRAQSRGSSTTLPQGHALVFTTRDRPVAARRGWSVGPMRHGVSTVRSGVRRTLGLVFHDAS
ncbi:MULTISPECIES: 2OG-Fe(II) oxygenase [Streptomyces]|uniref:2OG-Fe(II) oxygenase n=1 Tax=Streptomyces siderophoricus TaxID=2802281 RepID=A0ABS1MIT6_9ACTN|nr:2OG-Fe(II) oxygenase [Streptomyces sp. 9-7]MBL1087868.1 2OG-Fe(II) oxygenase [Streptomyces sp. 9-7]